MQLPAFEVVEYVPFAHVEQMRSAVLVPSVLTKVPAAQFVHAVQLPALVVFV